MGSPQQILQNALQLKSYEKFFVIEGLLQSLDEPNQKLDEIWALEAEKRLNAYKKGILKGIPMEDIFDDEG
ncbi:MAG: addiction module protein [Candidatus Parabeggiatoa sp. nov. 2]|nr:MAG: addiction module protein [Gammaproteobacteria bacterium]